MRGQQGKKAKYINRSGKGLLDKIKIKDAEKIFFRRL